MSAFSGRIIRANDSGWNRARRGFCASAPYHTNVPEAVMFCRNKDDIVFAQDWARSRGVGLCIRSGGHHYEGASSLTSGGIIVDVSEMNSLQIEESSSLVRVGSGVRMAHLYEALDQRGLGIPLAVNPTVGIAGLTLGGGFGMTSRMWGLTCDRLKEAELVLSDGRYVTASESENPDLFWACRGGGGGSFGIATSFTFDAKLIGATALVSIAYPWNRFAEVVQAFQTWAVESDRRIGSFLTVTVEKKISLTAQFTNADVEECEILPFFREMLNPALEAQSERFEFLPHQLLYQSLMNDDDVQVDQLFKSTSSFAYRPLPREAIEVLRLQLENAPRLQKPASQPSMVQLLTGGGQIAALESNATAAFHRKAMFVVQFNGYWALPEDELATVRWVSGLRRSLLPFTEGAYVNYSDSSVDDPWRSYFGTNLEQLKQIKKKYDPGNFFNGLHSIPVS